MKMPKLTSQLITTKNILFIVIIAIVLAALTFWTIGSSVLTRADTLNRCDYNRNGTFDEDDSKRFMSFYGKYKDVDQNLRIDIKDFDLYCRQNKNP